MISGKHSFNPPTRLGVGVIGVGLRGQHSYEQILAKDSRVKVTAVCNYPGIRPDVREGRTDQDDPAYAHQLGADYLGENVAALLAREDVQLVSLMCEPDRALELARPCLTAGKAVLRDKPVTCTAADALAMQDAADRAGCPLFLSLPLRYHTPLSHARARIRQGIIGDLLTVNMSYVWPSGPLAGFTASRGYLDAYGGGDVTTAGFHAIDYLNWLIAARPGSVHAEIDTFFYDDYRAVGMDDFGQLMIRYDNGVLATLVAGRIPRREGEASWLDVTGTDGTIEVNRFAPSIIVHSERGSTASALEHDPLTQLCRDVIDCILHDAPAPSHAGDGAAALSVLEAARRSAASHHVQIIEN